MMGKPAVQPPRPHPVRGYLYIAAAGLCWGISASLGKVAFSAGTAGATSAIDPQILAQSRTTISFLLLAPLLLLLRGARGLAIGRRDLWRCALLGVLGLAASNFFYYYAIAKTTVSIAIIVQYTAPVWVMLYMVARGRERATPTRVLAVLGAVLGSVLVIGIAGERSAPLHWIGIGASLLAAFSFSFYNVFGRDLVRTHDRWQVIAFAMLGASLFWMAVNPPWKVAAAHYTAQQWGFLLLFAVTSMLLPFSFYFSGLQHLDATRAIVTSCLEPVFTILIAATFLGESFRPLQAIGMAIVLAATIVVQMPQRAAEAGSTATAGP